MRNMRQWFSGAVMAALVQSLLGLSLFTSANGAPERAFEPQSAGPTLAIGDVSVNEGNAGATDVLVAVTLANPNGQTVTVDYQVVNGTAVRGNDYTVISTSGTMTFLNGGATTQRIRVTINGDTTNEPDETFFVNLSNATNATLADNQAVGTIINDDGGGGAGPTLAIADVSANEGNAGTMDVLAAVTLTNPNGQTVTVDYQVVDGSATRGSDYTVISTSGTMTFLNGGATTQRIRVTINGDATNESDETVLVNLSNATNATLTDHQGVGTIINDDGIIPPPVPSINLTATATGASTIALAWTDNSSDEDGFKIERKISGGVFGVIMTVGSNVNSFNDTGLNACTTYIYRMRAFKGTANSGYSSEALATTTGCGSPPTLAIADVSTNEGNAGATDVLVAVTLTNPNGETVTVHYQVGDGTATHGSDYTVISTSGTMTFFNGGATTQRIRVTINGDADDEPDETVLVNLSNATNATLTDNQGMATIINDDGTVAPPSHLSAITTSSSMASLVWTDNSSNEDGFKIERKSSGESFSVIATVGSNVNFFDDAGLSGGTTYTYRVRAFKGALNSDYSNEATVTPPNPPNPPNPPSNLIATATVASTVALAWTDNSNNETGFRIERKLSGGNFTEIITVGSNVNSFNDNGLSAGTTYVYRVRAFNGALNSNYSNEAKVTTPVSSTINLALNKPVTASSTSTSSFKPATNAVDGDMLTYWRSASATNLTAWLRVDLGTPQPVGRVVVKWKSDYHAIIYEIQVSNDDLNWTTVYSTSSGSRGVQELTFSPASARYVRIYMTKNNRGSYRILEFEVYSGASAAFAKQNESAAGAPEIPNEFTLQQNYPNPFSANGISDNPSTRISFNLPQASHVTIKIYTINGVEAATLTDDHYAAGAHAVFFKPKNLPSGTYFYVMQAGLVRKVRQLMLVK